MAKPSLPRPAVAVDVVHTVVDGGIHCEGCGRDMIPRIRRTISNRNQRYADCPYCAVRLLITYNDAGVPIATRKV